MGSRGVQWGWILSDGIGRHRCSLFDVMSGLRQATSHEIAAAAGLNERYVREWLGAMTTAGVIECLAVCDDSHNVRHMNQNIRP
jgi:hypothetical protein